ncbi:MAG: phosphomannomutase/phosphoglucomutase [Rhodospirillaceae bacterium]|nr:phosphomannomutase/phosphoglucomutase [Rhodospirillaceae bacterium]
MSETHRFDPTILREYDIRGTVDDNLSQRDAWAIGRAFGTILRESGAATACVARDGRASSPLLEAALVKGLMACGIEVWRLGLGPTPMLYFATVTLGAGGGIMVTGSHNPPDMNGFKFMLGKRSFFGQDIKRLGDIAAEGRWCEEARGKVEMRDLLTDYVNRMVQDFRPGRDLTVAWDAGNGAAGEAMARVVKRLPGRHILMYEEIDATFPNHHPDPTVPENLADLIETVRRETCDAGIAFDGDGDRIGVVDGEGRILWGDQLMVIFARELLARRPGETIIADVKASQVLFDEIARLGGKPLMWKTGHSLIKTKMAETNAPLAGEMSGHIFFADGYLGYDDALYAAIRLLSILAAGTTSLAAMRDALPSVVNTPELRIPCDEARKVAVVTEVAARLAASGADVSEVDGVRVRTKDGWWLLRASNTQAVLVARCEARDVAGLKRLQDALVAQLTESGVEFAPGAGH